MDSKSHLADKLPMEGSGTGINQKGAGVFAFILTKDKLI